MSLAEVLEGSRTLSRVEKLQLIQVLAQDLARDEGELIVAGQRYPLWSPHVSFSAADAMMKALDEDRQS